MTDRFQKYGPRTIARLLNKNELEGRDLFDCTYRAIVLLHEMAKMQAANRTPKRKARKS